MERIHLEGKIEPDTISPQKVQFTQRTQREHRKRPNIIESFNTL